MIVEFGKRTGKKHNCHMTEGKKDLWNVTDKKLECYGSKKYNEMNEQEMREYLKDKSEEEIREFIIDRLKKICEQGEKLPVEDEDYEMAGELLKIKNRLK
jgi:23S rRNA G2069 N7-methylase RlmK/C1962 C5-methylase RlmI